MSSCVCSSKQMYYILYSNSYDPLINSHNSNYRFKIYLVCLSSLPGYCKMICLNLVFPYKYFVKFVICWFLQECILLNIHYFDKILRPSLKGYSWYYIIPLMSNSIASFLKVSKHVSSIFQVVLCLFFLNIRRIALFQLQSEDLQ